MTKEQINRIFDPFIQAETGTTRKYGGTGLGLSITKKMIEMMGGELEVDSAPGIGSRFGFTLTFDTIDVKNSDRLDDVLIFNDMKKPTFSGEVLVCEDNSLNQQVICEHLTRVGIKSVVAENGKIGVDMVKKRVNRNEKMFDLIFMDIHMPVMDGLEAVEKILELETGVPIVALTANVMVHDRLIYKEKGMNDCLGKPFSTQELWRLLVKYFEPIRWDKDEENQRIKDESDLQRRLIINFVKNNANKFNEISDALKKGDIETAYRLTHTLKGNAGQLNKSLLQRAAKEVESLLKDGENLATPAHMTALEIELAAVMAEFSPLVDSHIKENIEYMDVNAAKELLDKVEPIVTDSDPECLNYLSELQRIQGSEALVRYIDDFDFKAAAKEIAALRGKL
jgi:CheY-like chemotaxis protein